MKIYECEPRLNVAEGKWKNMHENGAHMPRAGAFIKYECSVLEMHLSLASLVSEKTEELPVQHANPVTPARYPRNPSLGAALPAEPLALPARLADPFHEQRDGARLEHFSFSCSGKL